VAGLVLVDPAPIVTQPLADNLAPYNAIAAGQAGYDVYWSFFAALFSQEWVQASSYGTLVMSNHTTHAVTREDPALIVWAVQRVLSALARVPRP
jgi:hypothetical protein